MSDLRCAQCLLTRLPLLIAHSTDGRELLQSLKQCELH